ncbi:MAG: rRNA maturation RNase YbeY [Planctomycetes bacterium]|nr:rRNA maturation RNase YbeY [Planctomycetota bacterium]
MKPRAAGGVGAPSKSLVDVRFDVATRLLPLPAATLRAQIRKAVRATGYAAGLSVAVIDDAAMRVLNRTFHACDEPTDVLAFDLGGAGSVGTGGPSGPDACGGEVVVSIDTARMESSERGVTLASELLLYVVHGTLHLMGEDDHDPASYRRMHDRTLSILAGLGHSNTIDPAAKKLRSAKTR